MSRLLLFLLLAFATSGFAAPNEKSAYFQTSDGVRLHYIEAGQGRAIVFVPGWTMPAEIWRPQIDQLSAKYRVIALDPRSQGDSDKPADGNYPARRARDVKELVDELKLQKPVLVGWSMAVGELLSYVQQFGDDNMGGLVLVDGMVKIDPQMLPGFLQFLNKFQENRKQMGAEFVKSMYAKPQSADYLAQVTEASLKTPTNSAMAMMIGMLGVPDWTDAFKKLQGIPVEYHYESYMKPQAEIVKQALPRVKLVSYDDARHALFVDDADRFNKDMEELMGK